MLTHINSLTREKLETIFINYLNIIYLVKTHLEERFSELSDDANFSDLKSAIDDTLIDIRNQIMRIEAIYILMEKDPDMNACDTFVNMAEESFYKIQKNSKDPHIRDLNIFFYLQSSESTEMAAFQVLHIIASKLKYKSISKMLYESFEEAKADRTRLISVMQQMINV